MVKRRSRNWGLGLLVLAAATANTTRVQAEPTNSERASAARRTSATHPACGRAIGAFYWEIGDVSGSLARGSVTPRGSPAPVRADTVLKIASASKWVYAAYVTEKFGQRPSDQPFLQLNSGWSNYRAGLCPLDGTVEQCDPGEFDQDEALLGAFHYDGGHMQRHAIDTGLGPLLPPALTTEVQSVLGSNLGMAYVQPNIAGGLQATPADYGRFLRRLLGAAPALALGPLLGSAPVCTRPSETCPASRLTAVDEDWHYSVGHWIEDDAAAMPAQAFAFSSPGSFGFYPWIDPSRRWYGIVARQTDAFTGRDEGFASAKCGRVVRLAWITGVPQ
jgi:hypothetical protein